MKENEEVKEVKEVKEVNNSKFYHIILLLAATIILVVGTIYHRRLDNTKHNVPDNDAVELLRTEVQNLTLQLKRNELESIEDFMSKVVKEANPAIVCIKPIKQQNKPTTINSYTDITVNIPTKPITSFEKSFSGLLLDKEGYILTSANVAQISKQFKIVFDDKREEQAELVSFDEKENLALLKLQNPNSTFTLSPDTITDPIEQPGSWLVNLGRIPSGQHSVSLSMLSAIKRDLSTRRIFLLDPNVAAENDGSVVINLQGKIVGVNIQQSTETSTSGFTLPIRQAVQVVQKLKSTPVTPVPLSRIGVTVQDLDEKLKIYLSADQGIVVVETNNSTGLKPLDLITQVNGKDIESAKKFIDETSLLEPNTSITLLIKRNGQEKSIQLQTLALDDSSTTANQQNITKDEKLGVSLVQNSNNLLQIITVLPNSPIQKANLQVGDMILDVGGTLMKTPTDFVKKQKSLNSSQTQLWQIQRKEQKFYVVVQMGEN